MTRAKRTRHQKLPASGAAREALREKGQFWTPDWVAKAMVHYSLGGGSNTVFDPAVGEGAFFRAVKVVANDLGREIDLRGTEIDAMVLKRAELNGLTAADLSAVRIADFLRDTIGTRVVTSEVRSGVPPEERVSAIVANPPYIRHHRIPPETKALLREYGRALTGTALDGRAGYHIYFLLCALTRLAPDGRLAFIMPADTAEGVFSAPLWRWITRTYRLEAVIAFAPAATPFPGVDTNAVVFMIRNAAPEPDFSWIRCLVPETDDLIRCVHASFRLESPTLEVHRRTIAEGLATGLSRPPQQPHKGAILADYARVMRGIATGDNDFFFMTRARATDLGIPDEFLLPAIGRTRDLIGDGDEVTTETLQELESAGRPNLLFAPDGRALRDFPDAVREYLEEGKSRGVAGRILIMQRNPWYKMEVRKPPAFLFAYLGRRSARFIRNRAGVVPLTGFLCVYPKHDDPEFVERLASVLADPRTVANLARVGKSYGDGAIKVEPRSLDRLPLPLPAMEHHCLERETNGQGILLEV